MTNTMQNGRQTWPDVANTMQNAEWPCQNVANTMQNDSTGSSSKLLQIQGKWYRERKPKKNPKPEAKKNPKTILHPYIVGWVGSWIRCVASGRRTMSKCISVRIFICKCHLMSFAHIHKRTQFWVYIYNMHLNIYICIFAMTCIFWCTYMQNIIHCSFLCAFFNILIRVYVRTHTCICMYLCM